MDEDLTNGHCSGCLKTLERDFENLTDNLNDMRCDQDSLNSGIEALQRSINKIELIIWG
jgi:hypothetical protein